MIVSFLRDSGRRRRCVRLVSSGEDIFPSLPLSPLSHAYCRVSLLANFQMRAAKAVEEEANLPTFTPNTKRSKQSRSSASSSSSLAAKSSEQDQGNGSDNIKEGGAGALEWR